MTILLLYRTAAARDRSRVQRTWERNRHEDRTQDHPIAEEQKSLSHAGMNRIRSQGLLSAHPTADTPSDSQWIVWAEPLWSSNRTVGASSGTRKRPRTV